MSATGVYTDASLYSAFTICYGLASISTGLRLYVRLSKQRRRLQLEDYFMILSIFVFTASYVLSDYIVANKILHLEEIAPDQLQLDLKIVFILGFLYISDLWLIKASLLAFYTSIFSRPAIKLFIRLTSVYLLLTLIGCFLTIMLFCNPISSFWNPIRYTQDCHSHDLTNILLCSLTVTSDALVMIIPLSSLTKLRIGIKKKISLYLLFTLGAFAMVASVLRAAMSMSNSTSIAPVLLWSIVEEAVATLVVNGPILRVLVFKGQNFGSSSGPSRDTRGYTRDRSTCQDPYEMSNRLGKVTTTVSADGLIEGGEHGGVIKTLEVSMHSEQVKEVIDDGSSSEETFHTHV